MDTSILIRILLIILLLSLSAFFSASEASLFSLSRVHIKQLEGKKNKRAGIISTLLAKPHQLVISILIGNEIVNLAASSLAASISVYSLGKNLEETAKLIAIAIMTPVLMIFGELTPKVVGIQRNVIVSTLFAQPLYVFVKIIAPLRWIFKLISESIIRILGCKEEVNSEIIKEEEFKALVDVSEKEGVLEESERELIHRVFEFGDTTISEIITPKSDMFILPSDIRIDEIIREVKKSRFSRIPVYQNNRDNIIGMLYAKDLLNIEMNIEEGKNVNMLDVIRPPYFTGRNKKASDLFRDLQKEKIHMAIVLDEYGHVIGLITMEDLLEELFGEIRDEHR